MSFQQIIDSWNLKCDTYKFVVETAEVHHISARALMKTLRVARTIADIGQSESVTINHFGEALTYQIHDYLEEL